MIDDSDWLRDRSAKQQTRRATALRAQNFHQEDGLCIFLSASRVETATQPTTHTRQPSALPATPRPDTHDPGPSTENGGQDQACALRAHQLALLQHCRRPCTVNAPSRRHCHPSPFAPLTRSQNCAQQPAARGHRHLRSHSQEGPLRQLGEAAQGHQAGRDKSKVLDRLRRTTNGHHVEVIINGRGQQDGMAQHTGDIDTNFGFAGRHSRTQAPTRRRRLQDGRSNQVLTRHHLLHCSISICTLSFQFRVRNSQRHLQGVL